MIEQLIERWISEGKITDEEIDQRVAELKAQQPPSESDELKQQLADIWELILFGGAD